MVSKTRRLKFNSSLAQRTSAIFTNTPSALESRFAAGTYERMARELAQAGARVFLVNTIASVRAAQNVRPPVPVVMLAINDPVGTGLVASLARPASNTAETGKRSMTAGGVNLY